MSFGHFISGSITIEELEFNYKDYQGNNKGKYYVIILTQCICWRN